MKRWFEVKTPDLIVWNGWVVMSRSEEPLIRLILEELTQYKPKRLLEVGFGLGISSNLIQRLLRPKYHDIVEIDEAIYRDLRRFAAGKNGIKGIRGDFWTFKQKHSYDFIFYDLFDFTGSDFHPQGSSSKFAKRLAKRFNSLLESGGLVCLPHFGEGQPQQIHGYQRIMYKRLTVPIYPLCNGTYTEKAAVVCWQKP